MKYALFNVALHTRSNYYVQWLCLSIVCVCIEKQDVQWNGKTLSV